MPLQQKLDAFKAEFEGKVAPPEVVAVMNGATRALIASRQAARALKVGDRAPAFSLPDAAGRTVHLAELLNSGPVVAVFYRGIWCPYCNLDLAAIGDAAADIRALGASLVAISPQTPANSRRVAQQHSLDFPILSDSGGFISAAFGLRHRLPDDLIEIYKGFGVDLPAINADASWTLPMPARYVIATDGTVVYAEVSPDYTRRPDPSELLPTLERLRRDSAA
jgi:peroxiredoxin